MRKGAALGGAPAGSKASTTGDSSLTSGGIDSIQRMASATRCAGGMRPACGRPICEQDLGVEAPRRQHLDAHAVMAGLVRHGLAEPHHAELRRAVGRVEGDADETGLRREVQDVAAARGQHRRQHRAVGEEGAAQVGVQHHVPVGGVELCQRAQRGTGSAQDARRVHEDVDAAEGVERTLRHRLHVVSRAHVQRQHQGLAAARGAHPGRRSSARRAASSGRRRRLRAPSRARVSQHTRPMPLLAPVTIATRSFSEAPVIAAGAAASTRSRGRIRRRRVRPASCRGSRRSA